MMKSSDRVTVLEMTLSDYLLFLQTAEDTCLASGNTFDFDSLSCQRRKESTRIC